MTQPWIEARSPRPFANTLPTSTKKQNSDIKQMFISIYLSIRRFYLAAVVSILLYGCTTWTLTKQLMKKLDGNYTRMLRAILNKSWRQHPTRTNNTVTCLSSRKLYKLDEPDTQDTAGEASTNSSVMYSYGPPHMAKQKQDDQLEHTYSSYMRIRDVALKTCQKRWMIGWSGERGSGISMLAARHDDDDDLW